MRIAYALHTHIYVYIRIYTHIYAKYIRLIYAYIRVYTHIYAKYIRLIYAYIRIYTYFWMPEDCKFCYFPLGRGLGKNPQKNSLFSLVFRIFVKTLLMFGARCVFLYKKTYLAPEFSFGGSALPTVAHFYIVNEWNLIRIFIKSG